MVRLRFRGYYKVQSLYFDTAKFNFFFNVSIERKKDNSLKDLKDCENSDTGSSTRKLYRVG